MVETENNFSCVLCKVCFKTRRGLNEHSDRHKAARYSCKLCEMFFNSKTSLNHHIESFHLGVRYSCKHDLCRRSFKSISNLREHVKLAHLKQTLSCMLCNEVFKHRSTLKYHLTHFHKNLTQKCKFCKKTFMKQNSLYRHLSKWCRGKCSPNYNNSNLKCDLTYVLSPATQLNENVYNLYSDVDFKDIANECDQESDLHVFASGNELIESLVLQDFNVENEKKCFVYSRDLCKTTD